MIKMHSNVLMNWVYIHDEHSMVAQGETLADAVYNYFDGNIDELNSVCNCKSDDCTLLKKLRETNKNIRLVYVYVENNGQEYIVAKSYNNIIVSYVDILQNVFIKRKLLDNICVYLDTVLDAILLDDVAETDTIIKIANIKDGYVEFI